LGNGLSDSAHSSRIRLIYLETGDSRKEKRENSPDEEEHKKASK